MLKTINTIIALCLLTCVGLKAQTYAIRGTVIDAVTLQPLIGANIYIVSQEDTGTATDLDGEFVLGNLTIGQHQLAASFLGYQNYIVPIEVKSGKELVLKIMMSENKSQLNEVVVTAQNNKGRTVNTMAYASTRTFSVEESNRFAGAVDDPLRMVQSYAGVVGTEDGNNHISIRGNSPNGLLWRMEGIDIPNPNHYADPSSAGGGISALSSQMLSNSDFSTGAFAAEYGNALSGVFDLKLRKGNNKKREYTLKAGFLGLEASAEGPFSKNYDGSYLVNYRYSTLSVIDKLGVELNGVLNYSDLSYNVNLPAAKLGTFSLFGLHGVSSQDVNETLDTIESKALSHYSKGKFESNMSVDGLKHLAFLWKGAYLNSTVAYSKSGFAIDSDTKTVYTNGQFYEKYNSLAKNDKVTITSNLTQRLNKRTVVRTGASYDMLSYNVNYDTYFEGNTVPQNLLKNKDKANLFQTYAQIQTDLGGKWTSNVGAHFTRFLLNNASALEPRASIKNDLTPSSSISLSYGLHSQVNPLPVYFIKVDNQLVNENLDLAKAHHFVVTYQYDINPHLRLRSELYYQHLYNQAVGTGENKLNALLNHRFGYPDYAMTNEGAGKNQGIEVTLERFMHNDVYFILTGSLSDSKYKTKDSDWLNTRYNTNYSAISTFGKEWRTGKRKQNAWGGNLKATFVGGQYITPINLEASIAQGQEVLNDIPFTGKNAPFFKLDVGVKYRRNHAKYTSTLSLDVLNATNRKNVGGEEYKIDEQKVATWYQAPLIPVLAYKVEF